ncbi:hypothetical protein E2P81_ATG02081 [Venturia nashicola]|uniref:Uncharacterized protein n=1 Tax=Venturia nashicola TaxID=86259 RepID=A0A4Z1PCW6_9PEZI|nr:hypothetical protein E6O75_ATG02130 [Venturia nashicola]TLD35778.1 hypothetical protein E2P81_ATG02081 [Venturia nashicola]
MKFTIITALILAAGAAADYTVCRKSAQYANGICKTYTDKGAETGRDNVCASASLCLTDGNGCILFREQTSGGLRAHCH